MNSDIEYDSDSESECESECDDTPAKKGECVYCKDPAAYQCDRCAKSENGDSGEMCCGCADEHGHELDDGVFLCGGCYENRD